MTTHPAHHLPGWRPRTWVLIVLVLLVAGIVAAAGIRSLVAEPAEVEQRAASGDVAGLVLLLDDPDAAVRADAAEQLGELRASEAVSPLLDALRDTAPEVQVAAATALGEIGDGAAVRPLIRLLRDPGTLGVENAAAGALAALGDPRSVAPLLEAGQLEALAGLGRAAVPPLAAIVRTGKKAKDRLAAVEALAAIGGRRAVAALETALGDRNVGVWQAASVGLSELFRKDVDVLVGYLGSDATYRIYYGLLQLGRDGTEGALIQALEAYGDVTMAEDYLNCGNGKLEAAATDWADEHGYWVMPSVGPSGGPGWGTLG